jgi:hypothetical protein
MGWTSGSNINPPEQGIPDCACGVIQFVKVFLFVINCGNRLTQRIQDADTAERLFSSVRMSRAA